MATRVTGTTLILISVLTPAAAELPRYSAVTDTVDVTELNHFFDRRAEPVFTQAIFWRWRGWPIHQYEVVDWSLIKRPHRPLPCYRHGIWVLEWYDTRGVRRRVVSLGFRETWTQYDPELEEREKLPQNRRLGLTRSAKVR